MASYLWLLEGVHDVMLWLPLFAGKEDMMKGGSQMNHGVGIRTAI